MTAGPDVDEPAVDDPVVDDPDSDPAGDLRSVQRRGVALLAEMIRSHPGPFALSVAGSVLFATTSVAGAIVLGRVTDRLIIRADGETVTTRTAIIAGAVILAMSLGRAVGVVGRRYFGVMATRRMQMLWFNRLSDHYLDQPLRFFQAQPTGKLLAHTDNDAERSAFAMQPLPMSLGTIVLLVFSSISLAIVDPLLFLVAALLFPALMVMNRLYTARVEGPSARAQHRVGEISALAHESFEGALVVKLLGLEEVEAERMRVASDGLRQERLVIGRLRAVFEPALDALPALGTIALLAIGAWRVDSGDITTGDLVQAMALFGILAFPIRIVGYLLEELPRSVVSRDRIVDVLDIDLRPADAVADRDATRALPDGALDVVLDGVGFRHGDDAVLTDVSFRAAAGEVIAVVGPTGGGKSTLCMVLAGLLRPESGTVAIGGVDLARADPASVREAVAMVFQETFLFADTLAENLTLGTTATDDLDRVIAIAQADFTRALPEALDTPVGERGVTLSGGQRQRVALARALLRQPRLLILDDATSAIDPSVEARILDGLRTGVDTTTILVAHRVATIRLADRVIFLDRGRVVAEGTHDELLARDEAYASLVRAYEGEDAA